MVTAGPRLPGADFGTALAFGVAAHGEPGAQISWQAQYTEPSGGAAERAVAAGPRPPFVCA